MLLLITLQIAIYLYIYYHAQKTTNPVKLLEWIVQEHIYWNILNWLISGYLMVSCSSLTLEILMPQVKLTDFPRTVVTSDGVIMYVGSAALASVDNGKAGNKYTI